MERLTTAAATLVLVPVLLFAAASLPPALAGGDKAHKSKVSMVYIADIVPGTTDSFEGQVTSSKAKCVDKRKVKVYRERSGDDATVGSAKSSDEGFWFVHVPPAKAGTYYGKVKKRKIGNKRHEQTCKAATSKPVLVPSSREPIAGVAAKPRTGDWSGKTAQEDPLTGKGFPITFRVERSDSGRSVFSISTEVFVKCAGSSSKLLSPMDFYPAKVKKGEFVAQVEHGGPVGYTDVIRGKFPKKKRATGTLRSRWTGDRDCDSGKVTWSAKFRP